MLQRHLLDSDYPEDAVVVVVICEEDSVAVDACCSGCFCQGELGDFNIIHLCRQLLVHGGWGWGASLCDFTDFAIQS